MTVLWMTASPTTPNLETSIAFPFFKAVLLNVGWFYVLFAAFTLVGFSKVTRDCSSRPEWASASTYQNVQIEKVPSSPRSPSGEALGL